MAEEKTDSATETLQGIGCLVIVVLLFGLGKGIHDAIDEKGWLSHSRETTITARADWLVGESKTCSSAPIDPAYAKEIKRTAYDVTGLINCDNGDQHNIKVTFYGRTERSEKRARDFGVSWKCVKESGSFTCYAID